MISKYIMQKLTSVRFGSLVSAGCVKLGAALILLAGLTVSSATAQTSFYSPQVLDASSYWGTAANDNTGVTPDVGAPNIAGYAPNAPLWYVWTAPHSGEVELDTVGSALFVTNSTFIGIDTNLQPIFSTNISVVNLDTVLGVYVGNNVGNLSQIAANDDLFPINSSNPQSNIGPNAEGVNNGSYLNNIVQSYNGPSHLRFTAQGGITYYFAVDTKPKPSVPAASTGNLSLSWAYRSAGVFRFATEDQDHTTKMPLYQTAQTESVTPTGLDHDSQSVVSTYYKYNALGVLVTVTRTAGSAGRCSVDYSTVDGTALPALPTGDLPAFGEVTTNFIVFPIIFGGVTNYVTNAISVQPDFTPVSGTLVFDDYEMSKTILIPIRYKGLTPYDQSNRVFGITISNAQPDLLEASDVSLPRVDPVFSTAMVKILNVNADPYGPEMVEQVVTNTVGTNSIVVTNMVVAQFPTNAVFNFEKANYRVPADLADPAISPYNFANVTLYVMRGGTNTEAATVNYRINTTLNNNTGPTEANNKFPLQPASDYAVPTPSTVGGSRGAVSDFDVADGTLSFPSTGGNAVFYQPIHISIPISKTTKFNKDFRIQLYRMVKVGNDDVPHITGMNAETTVTILFNDENPPAGSVDQLYNADFNSSLALLASRVPVTTPADNSNPGVGGPLNPGQVYGLALLTNNEALIVGDFPTYNGVGRNCVALVDTNGQLDTSFNPGEGANGGVNAVAISGNQFYIGGSFTSYDSSQVGGIARLNADGSIDSSFNPGLGADGPVRAFAVLSNGEVLIAGDFTHINGAPCNYIALLNTNGVVDSTFNPGSNLTGPVYALALQGTQIMAGGNFNVAGQAYRNIIRLNANGSIDTTFNPGTGADGLVRTLAWQTNGSVILGGDFTHINGISFNHISRLTLAGTNDPSFFIGTGADDVVYNINLQADGTMYVGGAFGAFNGTHRRGFTRLYANGTVDTTFMDTAYNQFAGLKRIYSYDSPAVFVSALQSDGNILIGGSFLQVGGGQADPNVCNTLDDELFLPTESFGDFNLWVEPKARDGVRNRTGLARLIGGGTPGPGNISLNQTSFSANKSQSSLAVSLMRTNGTLGPISANFSVIPGLALSGQDYSYFSAPPLYWVGWNYISNPTRMRQDGLSGVSGFLVDPLGLNLPLADSSINNLSKVNVSIIKNSNNPGDITAQFQLANPSVADTFYLGGQNIPVGAALGVSTAPFKLVDDTTYPGSFGFISASFVATNSSTPITVLRSNGVFGVVSMTYSTTNGTAKAGTDYVGLTNKSLIFGSSVTSNGFNVVVVNNGNIYTSNVEKTVTLRLSNLGTTPGATFGISNAVLRLINPNFQGYVTLGASNYTGTMSSGVLPFVVNRVSGSLGTVTIQYATTNGSAVAGVDYLGATNTLTWNSGDVSPRTVLIPLINTGVVGTNKQFGVRLFNPILNGSANPALMGIISNATLTISNNNNYGTIQFGTPSYVVNENGGYVTITAVRTGGATGMVSVNYATSNGSNTASAVNYVATSGVLVFGPNQSSASFTVPVIDDGVVDSTPFYFNVALSSPTNAVLGSLTNAQINLFDVQASLHPPGSPDTAFNSDGMNGNVLTLALSSGGQILAGGNFTAVGPVSEGRLARLNTDGSLDTSFLNGLAGANAAINAVVSQTDDRILIGGAFTTINGIHRNFIARLMIDGTLDTSFNPGSGADSTINALAETFIDGLRRVYIGGAFGGVNGISSSGLVRLKADNADGNNDGAVDGSFNVGSGADGQIYAIAAYPTNSIYAGKVLIGGSFTHFNGVAINNLARLNVDGSLDTTFNAVLGSGPNADVQALVIQMDGRVLVGGSFTNFNETILNRIARLNTDGALDSGFTTAVGMGANNVVEGIRIQPDNRIVLVGQFTQVNGVTRNHITRLLPTGATDPTINFGSGANGNVNAVLYQPADGNLVIGGAFSQYDGQPHASIARIYGGAVTGSGAFTFTTGNFSVAENGIVAPITIRRTGGTSGTNADLSGDLFVNFATTSGGTAVNGINYLSVTTNVDFPAGEVLKTILVPVLDDFMITPNLTVNLALSNPTPPATNGIQPTATLTIVNVDSAVSFSSGFYTQVKNTPTGVAIIDVLRLGGSNDICSVDFYTTTNGTAIIGTDYYPTNATLTFNPGQSDIQVQIPIINNALATGNKTVGLVLSNVVNTILVAPSNSTLTIIDTVSAPGQLYFSATNFVANEGGGSASLTVLRTNGSSGSVSVAYNTVPGTAQPGLNYVTSSGTLTFGNGETMKSVTVPLVDNNVVQGPVNLSVMLSAPTGGSTLTAPTNTTLTIVDNDTGFAFVNATNYVRETNGTVPIFVQRIGGTNSGAQVNYLTTNGTALAGVNYTAVSGTLTFGAGEMLKVVTLPLKYVPQVTGDLSLIMKLSSPGAGTMLSYPSNSIIMVQDADAGFSFTNSAMNVFKNAGTALVTVVCSNPSIEPPVSDTNIVPLSVSYATVDGTALAGVDYAAKSGTLLFTNGVGTNTISVPIYNNSQVLGDHSFSVKLLNPTGSGQLVAPSVQVVTIVDNNSGLSFSSPVYKVLKTGVSSTITVVRTDNTNTTSTVNFSTSDGTAVSGIDYIPTNGLITFTNGETSKTFSVTVIANTTVQPDKTVLLQLYNPANGILIAPYAATLTIHDTTGSLVVPAGSTLVHESLIANGIVDPGENVTMLLALRASGGTNIPNVYATLLTTNGVTSPSPSGAVSYGSLAVGGGSVSRQFSFTANGTNSQQILATLRLSNGVTNIGTAVFTYTLGTWTTRFYNTNVIVINDLAVASPYPSGITVSNVGGVIIKSIVTFSNLTHGYTKDIEALVVSPAGQDTLLMSHAGNGSVSKITLTFDDGATNSLPSGALLSTGTNKPTAYQSTTTFP